MLAWNVGLAALFVIHGCGQRPDAPCSPPYKTTPLQVTGDRDLVKYWNPRGASIRERIGTIWGLVEIESTASAPIHGALFYAEYFDADGRLCFTLLFSTATNEQGRKGEFQPRETRTLYSGALNLAVAAEPREVRLHLLSHNLVGLEEARPPRQVIVRIPPTIADTSSARLGWASLQLSPELLKPTNPVLDLVLARVEIGKSGTLDRTEVLRAREPAIELWFEQFVRRLRFQPAIRNDSTEASTTLVLVRAVLGGEGVSQASFLPRESAWVKEYLHSPGPGQVPIINELHIGRPATRVKPLGSRNWKQLPAAPPGYFEYLGGGSVWSLGIPRENVSNLLVPGQLVRPK